MADTPAKQVGDRGETLAAEYLQRQGYTIVDRNWHDRTGELDIVARDANGVWVFVEVKTRRAADANPLEALTPRKRRALTAAAQFYLAKNGLEDEVWRIDVIAVTFQSGKPPHIEHFQDAFDW